MQDLRDAAADGIDEGLGLGEAACLIGELAEDQLGVIGLAEELAVEPALQAVADGVVRGEELDEPGGDEDEDRDGDRQIFLVPDERKDEVKEDEGDEGELGYQQRIAGERVLGAHAQEEANIQRTLHHDDVGEGEGRGEEEQVAGKGNPRVLIDGDTEVRQQDERLPAAIPDRRWSRRPAPACVGGRRRWWRSAACPERRQRRRGRRRG